MVKNDQIVDKVLDLIYREEFYQPNKSFKKTVRYILYDSLRIVQVKLSYKHKG